MDGEKRYVRRVTSGDDPPQNLGDDRILLNVGDGTKLVLHTFKVQEEADDPNGPPCADFPLSEMMMATGPAEELFKLLASSPPTAPETDNPYALILANANKGQKAAIKARQDILDVMGPPPAAVMTPTISPVKWHVFGGRQILAVDEIVRRYMKGLKRPAVSTLPPRVRPFGDTILYKSDTVHGAVVRSVSAPDEWKKNIIDGFAYGQTYNGRNLTITVGLPSSPQADDLWTNLLQGGARTVKAHYVLWGRWYENGGKPGEYITVNINQFCSDLGYKKASNGGFKRERKQEAAKTLNALTSIEIRATCILRGQGRDGKDRAIRLRGPVWSRGLLGDENDQYDDIFGQAREGDPSLWTPAVFSYAPGPWFADPEWRRYNDAIGKIGVGLMRLDPVHDEWALLIGGYMGTIMRTRHYKPLILGVGTILRAIGKASADTLRRKQRTQDKFERALERLREERVIDHWEYNGTDAAELSDPDDPEEVAAYYGTDAMPQGDWLRQCVTITLPKEMDKDRERLDDAQKAARVKAARRRRALPPAT